MKQFNSDVIEEYAAKVKLPRALAEKDYVLSVLLYYIYKSKFSNALVFKGGTCLRKAYFENYRFSSDLDFTMVKSVPKVEVVNYLKKLIETDFEGVSFVKLIDKSLNEWNSLNLTLQYKSKIGDEPEKHADSVVLDFNFQNNVILKPNVKTINAPVDFLIPSFEINCLDLSEVLAEKVHAIYNRPKPRDLYDLNYLIEKNIQPDLSLINKKLNALNKTYTFNEFTQHVEKQKEKWNRDMTSLLQKTPDFQETSNKVLNRFKKL